MSALDTESSTRTSVVGHFRVWKDVYDSLEDEARTRRISLNTLVNQLLSTHTRDELLKDELGFVRMPKGVFRLFLEFLPEDRLSELGMATVKAGPDAMMLAKRGTVTLDAVLDDLCSFSKSGWFSLHRARENGKEIISLIHDFGPRKSVILSGYVKGLFALAGVHPKITTTNSSVTIEY